MRGWRPGSDFPSCLEPRRRAERAWLTVGPEADVLGIRTRKEDERVQALGLERRSQSEARALGPSGTRPWNAFAGGRRKASARERGEREGLGVAMGAAETYGFWLEFRPGWVARGRKGVRLVLSECATGWRGGGRFLPCRTRLRPASRWSR